MQLARTSDKIQNSIYNRDGQKGSQEKIRDQDLRVFLFPSEILFRQGLQFTFIHRNIPPALFSISFPFFCRNFVWIDLVKVEPFK